MGATAGAALLSLLRVTSLAPGHQVLATATDGLTPRATDRIEVDDAMTESRHCRPRLPREAIRGSALLEPRNHLAGEALEARVHLPRPEAGRHRPGDEIGDAVLGDERGQLGDAVVDVSHHPGLGNAGLVPVPGDVAPGLGEEARVELAAIALRRTDGGP